MQWKVSSFEAFGGLVKWSLSWTQHFTATPTVTRVRPWSGVDLCFFCGDAAIFPHSSCDTYPQRLQRPKAVAVAISTRKIMVFFKGRWNKQSWNILKFLWLPMPQEKRWWTIRTFYWEWFFSWFRRLGRCKCSVISSKTPLTLHAAIFWGRIWFRSIRP